MVKAKQEAFYPSPNHNSSNEPHLEPKALLKPLHTICKLHRSSSGFIMWAPTLQAPFTVKLPHLLLQPSLTSNTTTLVPITAAQTTTRPRRRRPSFFRAHLQTLKPKPRPHRTFLTRATSDDADADAGHHTRTVVSSFSFVFRYH